MNDMLQTPYYMKQGALEHEMTNTQFIKMCKKILLKKETDRLEY